MHACASNAKNPKRVVALPENNYRTLIVPAVILIAVTLADQITKVWAVNFLTPKGSVEIIGQFIKLTLVYNEGGALGTNFGPSIYYLITSILILALLIYYIIVHRAQKLVVYPLSFVAGGALGNIIDRIFLGKVVDWIDMDFVNVDLFGYTLDRWWTFNIADAAISCSIVFIIVTMFLSKFSKHGKTKDSSVTGVDKLSTLDNS